jgi:hypothetical protein
MNESVSLTCEALVNNARRWSITCESGTGPLCWWDPTDTAGSPCWDDSLKRLPKAYVVIKVALSAIDALVTRRWKAVAIGVLEPDSLSTTMRHIMPWLQRLPATRDGSIRRGTIVREFFSLLNAGMFSLVHGCSCTGVSVCCACCRVNFNKRRFVTQHRYQGTSPCGPGHWFIGTTDAVGDIVHGQLMWLSCGCGPHV